MDAGDEEGAMSDGARLDELVEFATALRWELVPRDVRDRALSSIADTFGVMLGGRGVGAGTVARRYLQRFETAGRPLAGSLSPASSAWFLGIAGHVLDFDDTHWPTILHASNPILSALAASGEQATGRAYAEAYLAGFETAARVALSMPKGHYDRGWHVTGTVGGIGAAVAVGRIRGESPEVLRRSVSLAAGQAGGHRQHFGSMAKALNGGNAARVGLVSALLAGEGFLPDPEGLEGRRGMWAVMSDGPDPGMLSEGLGEQWEMSRNGLKPYPCGVVSHPAIEVAERVRERHLSAESEEGKAGIGEITAIELIVHPLVTELTNKDVSAEFDVKFSVKTLVALGLLDRAGDPANFGASGLVGREEIERLAGLVTVVDDRGSAQDEAEMVVELADGRKVSEKVTEALGSPNRPVPPERTRRKFVSLCSPGWGPERSAAVFDRLVRLDEVDEAGPLLTEIRDAVLGGGAGQ
jgi:2-methylcitrate dehydratase PrpD